MAKTRKTSRNKGKIAIDYVSTSQKSTSDSLNLPLSLAYGAWSFRKDQDVEITKKSALKKVISTKNMIFFVSRGG